MIGTLVSGNGVFLAALVAGVIVIAPANAEVMQFGSARHCVSSRRLPADVCANAAANAAAEFEEKAPRFPSRDSCERVYRRGCALGFRGAAGFAGRGDAIFFTPRQDGFRIVMRSDRDIRVTPAGPDFRFSSRTALAPNTSIRPNAMRTYQAAQTHSGGPSAVFGVATPEGPKQAVPPAPPYDPDFDCASVLEPGSDPATGCVPVPLNRR